MTNKSFFMLRTAYGSHPNFLLGAAVFLAVTLRLIIPTYDWITNENPWFFQFVQPAQFETEKVSSYLVNAISSGESVSQNSFQLTSVRGEWAYVAWLVLCKYFAKILAFDYNILIKIKILQALCDGIFGTWIVRNLLTRILSPSRAALGGLVYACWPPAIFYSIHLCAESFTIVLLLASALLFVRAIEDESIMRWLAFAFFMGFAVCFRINNILVFFMYMFVMLFLGRRSLIKKIFISIVLLVCFMIPVKILSSLIPLSNKQSSIGIMLYNAMGEYPGTFKGFRFFDDDQSLKHVTSVGQSYLDRGDFFVTTAWNVYPGGLGLYVWLREVVFPRPVLYGDWLVRRFIMYLPAHPYVAAIGYFLSNSEKYQIERRNGTNYKSMFGYRYSQLFNGIKYIDYLLFCLFMGGVWLARRSLPILTTLSVYFGVHIFHVFMVNGETFFRHDAEFAFLELRYLLGMVAIWPIFIAISLNALYDKFAKKNFPEKCC